MKKHQSFRAFLLACCLLAFTVIFAQNPNRVSIKGIVGDTLGETLPSSTVMLLNPKDSALLNFTRSDDKGAFEFKNVKNTDYLLKISFVGYIPFQQNVTPSVSATQDLGILKMKPITKELMEVVIKTAKAPLSIRGDTIEYNASSFKVPPGSTVEDLLRRLPGIEVDAAGNIKAQGKDVRKVTVDGKTFFSDDPKAATKNLDANVISKVQVFNEKSEQAKLTGVDDGKKEKVMNLELKEEFKKGAFGKLTAAGGTSERWAARGNYNRFNKKEQFSVIGFGNNINETGLNWEDYGEFKGQNTFNNQDNGDFGFGSNNNRFFYADGGSITNNFDGRGFTDNLGGGINYNFDNKKIKWNSSYFYNQTRLTLDQYSFRQTFLPNSSFFNNDTTNRLDFRGNHNVQMRYEQEIDSNNTLILKLASGMTNTDAESVQSQLFAKNDVNTNRWSFDNDNEARQLRLSSSAIFRHRFKKKGRSFAASGGYDYTSRDATENLLSINRFFDALTPTEQIRQLNTNDNATQKMRSSLLFTEPLSKKFFFELFYNFSQTGNDVLRRVQNAETNFTRIDSLSTYFDNKIMYNRVGTSVRYAHEGKNVAVGLAAQQIRLKGLNAIDEGLPYDAPIEPKPFNNIIPYFSTTIEFKNNIYTNFDYSYDVSEPKINDLQPVRNVANQAFVTEGNPNLLPERNHNLNFNLNYWNPASFASLGLWTNVDLFDSQIIYNQNIEILPQGGLRTVSRPENLSGGRRIGFGFWGNYPIIKTKLTLNGNGNLNFGKSPSFVNGVENETTNDNYSLRLGLTLTLNDKLILGVSGNLQNNNIKYSIQSQQNQKIRNETIESNVKWNFAPKFFFESNFNYSSFRNDRFDFNQSIPIWNASVRRILGKNNKMEMRLAAFDVLNRRVSITQSGTQNFVSRNIAETLARYFMLSATYNMRGFENKLKKNNWW